MPPRTDITGKKFGRLTVIKYVSKNVKGNYRWSCVCDCGKEKIIIGDNLKNGHTQSCGCLRIEQLAKRSIKHGHNSRNKMSSTYKTWASMVQRCTNPNDPSYDRYGGRRIFVCSRWSTFENFLEDMGERPENKSIDRIDNDGNYCKSNCK